MKNNLVMVVDDTPYLLETIKRILMRKGFMVITCQSAETAMAKLIELHMNNKQALYEQSFPKVVISDYNMPQANGNELLTAVKICFPNVHRVLWTADPSLAHASAAEAIIEKSNIDELIREVKQWTKTY